MSYWNCALDYSDPEKVKIKKCISCFCQMDTKYLIILLEVIITCWNAYFDLCSFYATVFLISRWKTKNGFSTLALVLNFIV